VSIPPAVRSQEGICEPGRESASIAGPTLGHSALFLTGRYQFHAAKPGAPAHLTERPSQGQIPIAMARACGVCTQRLTGAQDLVHASATIAGTNPENHARK
jgi:hypothetical protein